MKIPDDDDDEDTAPPLRVPSPRPARRVVSLAPRTPVYPIGAPPSPSPSDSSSDSPRQIIRPASSIASSSSNIAGPSNSSSIFALRPAPHRHAADRPGLIFGSRRTLPQREQTVASTSRTVHTALAQLSSSASSSSASSASDSDLDSNSVSESQHDMEDDWGVDNNADRGPEVDWLNLRVARADRPKISPSTSAAPHERKRRPLSSDLQRAEPRKLRKLSDIGDVAHTSRDHAHHIASLTATTAPLDLPPRPTVQANLSSAAESSNHAAETNATGNHARKAVSDVAASHQTTRDGLPPGLEAKSGADTATYAEEPSDPELRATWHKLRVKLKSTVAPIPGDALAAKQDFIQRLPSLQAQYFATPSATVKDQLVHRAQLVNFVKLLRKYMKTL